MPRRDDLATIVIVGSARTAIGVFLVLRRMALISDAISHVLLLGIVLAFFVARDLTSPLLLIGAALTAFHPSLAVGAVGAAAAGLEGRA